MALHPSDHRSFGSLLSHYTAAFIVGLFAVSAVTGLMMVFHIAVDRIKILHEWMGVGFVIAAIVHLICNWRGVLGILRRDEASLAVFSIALICLIFLTVGSTGVPGQDGLSTSQLANRLEHMPLTTVAMALGEAPDVTMARLQAQGMVIRGVDQTLADVAAVNRTKPLRLWRVLLTSSEVYNRRSVSRMD